jgi:hypothetical protein
MKLIGKENMRQNLNNHALTHKENDALNIKDGNKSNQKHEDSD